MNKQSICSFNKISLQMDRLTNLIQKDDQFRLQLRSALFKNQKSDDSSSSNDNLDRCFQQNANSTAKSIPFFSRQESYQQNSSNINTIDNHINLMQSKQWNVQNNDKGKTSLILGDMKIDKKQQQHTAIGQRKQFSNHTSDNSNNQISKKHKFLNSSKLNSTKHATCSIPSQISASFDQNKQENTIKNVSLLNGTNKPESIVANLPKNCKNTVHLLQQDTKSPFKQSKTKFVKVSKIDREQLNRLQQRKMAKKGQQSSNRTKTKRDSIDAKIAVNSSHPQRTYQNRNNFKPNLTLKNSQSSKALSSNKKQTQMKKNYEQTTVNQQSWLRTLKKAGRKLNRINISKLQQNIKKTKDKKIAFKDITRRKAKDKLIVNKRQPHKVQQLNLQFTEQDEEIRMLKILQQKKLNQQYARHNQRYSQVAKKMSKGYFKRLIKQFRQSSKGANQKAKLILLMLYFLNQFTKISLLSNRNRFINSQFEEFHQSYPQDELIQVLLHPKKIIVLIQTLPQILMNKNTILNQSKQILDCKFTEIDSELDQQLELFLIKKSQLYIYMHTLCEYVNFLVSKQLVRQTKRSKLLSTESQKNIDGFYSSRVNKQIPKRYVKTNESSYKLGLRCDSDRKITLEDEDLYFKNANKQYLSPALQQNLPRKIIR